jgi:hypothetical protein
MLAVSGLAVMLSAGMLPAVGAASCTGVTIAQGQGLTLDVSSVLVTTGGCVRFANLTDVAVTVRVSGSSFSERIPAKTPASASGSFTVTKSATVTASDGLRTGHGTITTEAPPPPPPSATTTFIPPPVDSIAPTTPTHTPKAPPTPSESPSSSPTASHTDAAAALPTLPSLPPEESSAPPAASHPVVAPRVRGSDPQLSATVLEPVSGPSRGLPAVVAAVVVIGLAIAFGRTVLAAAPPVDRRGRHARYPI